jgi:hypothetical protein
MTAAQTIGGPAVDQGTAAEIGAAARRKDVRSVPLN